MYKLFDDAAEKHLIKKTVYDKDNTEKNKFILDYIRKQVKKKPHMDYCTQLWMPKEGPYLDKIEKIIYNFPKIIPEIRNLDYLERLARLRIQSTQKRY